MKKTRRTILFLESLENRVVPSNTHALLDADHGVSEAPAMVAELETPRVENDARAVGVSQAAGASETAKVATIWDGLSSSVSDASNLSNGEPKEHTNANQAEQTDSTDSGHSDSDQGGRGAKSLKAADEGSAEDATSSIDATIKTSAESMEGRATDSADSGSGNKVGHDSENGKTKDSESDLGNSNSDDSFGNSTIDRDSVSVSKNNSDNGSTKDKDALKSTSSSNDSRTGSDSSDAGSTVKLGDVTGSATNNGSAKGKDDVKSTSSSDGSRTGTASTDTGSSADTGDANGSGIAVSKNSDSTGTSSVTDRTNHGKSNSDHKDQGTGDSTNTPSADSIQNGSASDIAANQSKLSDTRLAAGSVESSPSVNESVGSPAAGLALGEGGTAAFSSVAAIMTAKEAGLNLPRVADAAIPLAVPVLESLTPLLGLGDLGEGSTLAAIEGLAPVAGDLIVGFLPVEQVALGPAMQGVLNQIDDLGEQLIGSSAARWLYPFIFTALAATTVYQLASRRRRQFRGQSVWARDGASWSSTWFPLLGSSIQE